MAGGPRESARGFGVGTYSDHVAEPAHVLHGAQEVQAREGLPQRAVAVPLQADGAGRAQRRAARAPGQPLLGCLLDGG